MSRQNKVNPGMYTQRGRLTQDDAARELRKQSATRSPHTWQPVNTRTRPGLAPAGDADRDTERSADNETMVETSPQVERRPASRVTRNRTATKAAPSTAKAKAAKAKTARTRKSKRTTGNAKRQDYDSGIEADDDEADAKSRADPQRRRPWWCRVRPRNAEKAELSRRQERQVFHDGQALVAAR